MCYQMANYFFTIFITLKSKYMIHSINKNKINCINFKAIPLAEYGYLDNSTKNVIIYQLEKKDTDYAKHIIKNLDKFYKKYDIDNTSAKQVLKEALKASIAILKDKKHLENKARILMSFYDNKPSSILIGNVIKTDKRGNFHYSSRKEHGAKETELDWLVTFNKNIPKEGQATVNEYFHTLLNDGFSDCFVRSELQTKSSAISFYLRMGFKKLSNFARTMLRKDDYPYAIGKYDNKADKIVPMLASNKDIINTMREKDRFLIRKEIKTPHSYTLPKEIF